MVLDLSSIEAAVRAIAITSTAAFVLSMAITPIYTYFAFKYKAWKVIRATTTTGEKAVVFQKLHAEKHKRNIPTMAGIIMVLAIAIVTAIFNLSREQTYLPLFAMVAAGAVGLLDDFINIRGQGLGVAGLRSRLKFLLILAIAAAISFYAYFKLGYVSVLIPFLGQVTLSVVLIPLYMFVIVAIANAVNISDGLDGLAGGLLAIAFGTYSFIGILQGNYGIALFCATVVGSLLAYTWFNIYPARFFMGDVGSFSMGAALGVVALLTDTLFLLPVIGGMFVIEAGSSSVQILSKKIRKKKIFISAPIHQHFEALGWPETKVTMRFWVLGCIFGSLGMILGIIGGLL